MLLIYIYMCVSILVPVCAVFVDDSNTKVPKLDMFRTIILLIEIL